MAFLAAQTRSLSRRRMQIRSFWMRRIRLTQRMPHTCTRIDGVTRGDTKTSR